MCLLMQQETTIQTLSMRIRHLEMARSAALGGPSIMLGAHSLEAAQAELARSIKASEAHWAEMDARRAEMDARRAEMDARRAEVDAQQEKKDALLDARIASTMRMFSPRRGAGGE